jgi:hypothetical protein
MKELFVALTLMISLNSFAQTDYDRSIDKENEAVVFKGQLTFDDLQKEPSFSWFSTGAASYKPDSADIKLLKKHLPNYNLVVLLGTWCDDSQLLIPRLYKVLTASAFPMDKYAMYGVDRAKEAKYVEHKLYRLEKVPTIIVYRGHTEVGRIVETTKKSIEKDLAGIIEVDIDHNN